MSPAPRAQQQRLAQEGVTPGPRAQPPQRSMASLGRSSERPGDDDGEGGDGLAAPVRGRSARGSYGASAAEDLFGLMNFWAEDPEMQAAIISAVADSSAMESCGASDTVDPNGASAVMDAHAARAAADMGPCDVGRSQEQVGGSSSRAPPGQAGSGAGASTVPPIPWLVIAPLYLHLHQSEPEPEPEPKHLRGVAALPCPPGSSSGGAAAAPGAAPSGQQRLQQRPAAPHAGDEGPPEALCEAGLPPD